MVGGLHNQALCILRSLAHLYLTLLAGCHIKSIDGLLLYGVVLAIVVAHKATVKGDAVEGEKVVAVLNDNVATLKPAMWICLRA